MNKLFIFLLTIGLLISADSVARAQGNPTGENVDVRTGINHSEYDRLLKKYVNDRGLVNYDAWKQNAADLSDWMVT